MAFTVPATSMSFPVSYENDTLFCTKLRIQKLGAQLVPPLYSLVFIAGLLGNVMVVVILIRYRRLKNLTNVYLLNLAASDLVYLFTLPFWVHYVIQFKWKFGNFMCKLLSGLYALGVYSEIFFIVLLTVDRYLAIVHAVLAMRIRTVTFGVVTSVLSWSLAALASFPEFVFHEASKQSFCVIVYPKGEEVLWMRFYAVRMNVLCFTLPLLVMAICYSGIIKTLLRCPNRKKQKAIRLIFAIMVVFFIFWTPYSIMLLFSAFDERYKDSKSQHSKHMDLAILVTKVIALTHSCVNPIIYAFVSENFQKYLRHFFYTHVAMPLGRYLSFLSTEKLRRTSSLPPSSRGF
ncbi:putative C-C chemokine receptor type 3 [Ctenodactylus gundi]